MTKCQGRSWFFVANQDAKLLLSIDVSGHDAWIWVRKIMKKVRLLGWKRQETMNQLWYDVSWYHISKAVCKSYISMVFSDEMSILDNDGIHYSTTNPRKKMVETCHYCSRWKPESKSIKIDSSAINKPVDPVVCFRLGFSCWTIKKRPGKLRWNINDGGLEDDFPLIFRGVLSKNNESTQVCEDSWTGHVFVPFWVRMAALWSSTFFRWWIWQDSFHSWLELRQVFAYVYTHTPFFHNV